MENKFDFSVLKNKRAIFIAALLALGIILVFASSFGKKDSVDDAVKGERSLGEYKEELEGRVAALCTSVEGVGKCKVFITFKSGEEKVYRGGSVIETKPPVVLGVTVICRGAESDAVRYALIDMLSALFDIGTNRIAILKLNS